MFCISTKTFFPTRPWHRFTLKMSQCNWGTGVSPNLYLKISFPLQVESMVWHPNYLTERTSKTQIQFVNLLSNPNKINFYTNTQQLHWYTFLVNNTVWLTTWLGFVTTKFCLKRFEKKSWRFRFKDTSQNIHFIRMAIFINRWQNVIIRNGELCIDIFRSLEKNCVVYSK